MDRKDAVVEVFLYDVNGICGRSLIYSSIIPEITIKDDNFVLDGVLGRSYKRTFRILCSPISVISQISTHNIRKDGSGSIGEVGMADMK
jgi:hypothetical protein